MPDITQREGEFAPLRAKVNLLLATNNYLVLERKREAEIREREAEAHAREAEIWNHDRAQLEGDLAQRASQIKELLDEAARSANDLVQARARCETLESEVKRFRTSTSWRVTAPIRWVSVWLRSGRS